ncbi:hypothetical protein BP6252_08185 [Coleophoma cylindrospora]|uniref:ER transporter 6TM N-terminal domain-containing protein n=1 Tax=Coleophoma cylindrospora TaxID=1849047 RepID=A0A3D8RC54_9HELO|nr:hypothetical protein BP6252_08185 [Coleophoma cylindrospora]
MTAIAQPKRRLTERPSEKRAPSKTWLSYLKLAPLIMRIKRIRRVLGLDNITILKMLKGALPPTIAVSIYQASAITDITLTVGYLTALISVASQCLLPRAKFIKIMYFNLLATCSAAAICALAIFCAVKAREHTLSPDSSVQDYNSSACVVAAIWLVLSIWSECHSMISNTFRAIRPAELQDPMVAFSIFSGINLTHAGKFATISEGFAFLKQLLLAFLLGFAIATAVSLFILPLTVRRDVFSGIRNYGDTIQKVLELDVAYLETTAEVPVEEMPVPGDASTSLRGKEEDQPFNPKKRDKEAALVRSTMASLVATHDGFHKNLSYAKHEIAWGHLTPMDLEQMFLLFRAIFLPVSGLSMLPKILVSLEDSWQPSEKISDLAKDYQGIATPTRRNLQSSAELVKIGIHHSLVTLGISPKPAKDDLENIGDTCAPGSKDFLFAFKLKAEEHQVQLKSVSAEHVANLTRHNSSSQQSILESDEKLFVLLFVENLLGSLIQAVLELAIFASSKVADGTMTQNRLIFPQHYFIQDGFLPVLFGLGHKTDCGDHQNDANDPEHLAPTNYWQKLGNSMRAISSFLASEPSVFGFRVACASFTVAILAYLHQTQNFFFEQRLIWALIIIVIGMSPTVGASLFSFAGRIIVTIISCILSFGVWYIVNGHTAGVIVFLYIANIFEYYFYIKYPQFFGSCVIAIVTMNIILAYELQINKIGITVGESSGQPYYPIYLFAPYKVLCVIAGCFVALFWTVFPYPISARSKLRKILGSSLFVLANFYSCMHTTVNVWIGHVSQEEQPDIQKLEVARKSLFSQEMSLITALRMHINFTRYEPTLGGQFPRATHDGIILDVQSTVISMALMIQITKSLDTTVYKESWLCHLADMIEFTDFNAHSVTSLLCHLSAAVSNSCALPPYLIAPKSFPLIRKLRQLDTRLVDIKNAVDPTFAAFASLEVLSSIINSTLEHLISDVKMLVGEVNFEGFVKRKTRIEAKGGSEIKAE